jgi:hypothetical protein
MTVVDDFRVHVICLVKDWVIVNSSYEFDHGQILALVPHRAPVNFIQSVVDIGDKTSHNFILSDFPFDEGAYCSSLLWVLQNNHYNLIHY